MGLCPKGVLSMHLVNSIRYVILKGLITVHENTFIDGLNQVGELLTTQPRQCWTADRIIIDFVDSRWL